MAVLAELSHPHTRFGSRLCWVVTHCSRDPRCRDRYALLKLEQRFPEAKELWPSQAVLLAVHCGRICPYFAIPTSGSPSTLPLGGVIFVLATSQLRCFFSWDCHQCNSAVVSLFHCFRSLFCLLSFPPSQSSWSQTQSWAFWFDLSWLQPGEWLARRRECQDMPTKVGKSPPTTPFSASACWVLKSHKLSFLPAEMAEQRSLGLSVSEGIKTNSFKKYGLLRCQWSPSTLRSISWSEKSLNLRAK